MGVLDRCDAVGKSQPAAIKRGRDQGGGLRRLVEGELEDADVDARGHDVDEVVRALLCSVHKGGVAETKPVHGVPAVVKARRLLVGTEPVDAVSTALLDVAGEFEIRAAAVVGVVGVENGWVAGADIVAVVQHDAEGGGGQIIRSRVELHADRGRGRDGDDAEEGGERGEGFCGMRHR